MFDESLTSAYLAHLGLEREPPSVAALDRLVAAHLDRVPFETTWIALGERWIIDPVAAARRIVDSRRGGYCFILNDAFATLLSSLGYAISRHVGGVHGADGPDEAAMTNHLVLLVDLADEGRWYAEVGMGDGPVGAIALAEATFDQPPYRYELRRTSGVADWDLRYGPAGAEPIMAMAFREVPVEMDAFATRHVHLSTSPESGFVRVPTAQRRRRDGLTIVRACTLTRADAAGATVAVVERRVDWFELLADEFGLTFAGVAPAALDRLWDVVRTSHEAHAAGPAAPGADGTVTP